MTQDSAGTPRDGGHRTGGQHERFAVLIEQGAPAILASYERSLMDSNSPLMGDPSARDQALAHAEQITADVVASVRAGAVHIDDKYKLIAWTIGEARAASQLSPADSLRAASIFFTVTVNTLTLRVEEDPTLLPSFVIAVLALNESINSRVREATLAYTGYLINRIHLAHLEERHRIARELHDRLGEGLSAALRQLELHELSGSGPQSGASLYTSMAKGTLTDAMQRLRMVMSDLRQDPITSLEKALSEYIASVSPEADVRLRVSGDQTWASPTVIDEAFMIIREALRNAINHARASLILVGIDLAPHELHAWVDDDGRGFVPPGFGATDPTSTAGLATMQERAGLIRGRLTVSSAPGQGTQVDLLVHLGGPNGDAEEG